MLPDNLLANTRLVLEHPDGVRPDLIADTAALFAGNGLLARHYARCGAALRLALLEALNAEEEERDNEQ